MNYIKGIIWVLLLSLICIGTGSAVERKHRNSQPYRFLTGYLIYSFGTAVIGYLVQFVFRNIAVYRFLMTFWILVLTAAAIIGFYKDRSQISWKSAERNLNNYGFFYLILVLVLLFSVLNYPTFWMGNHLDDGFYLGKISTFAGSSDPFQTDPATGLEKAFSLDAYALNTGEMESAYFVGVLNIPVTLFTRFFLAGFHFAVFGSCIYCLTEKIFHWMKVPKKNNRFIQFIPALLFLFAAMQPLLKDWNLISLQDSWQTTTAMYYGSSVVRTSGFFLLLLPFLDQIRVDRSVILKVIGISVILISKSTIALPVIAVASFSYLILAAFFSDRNGFRNGLLLWIGIGLTGFLAGKLISTQNLGFDSEAVMISTAVQSFLQNSRSLLVVVSFTGFALAFLKKSRKMNRFLYLLAVCASFFFVPGLNSIVALTSLYSFVAARAVSAYFYFLISAGFGCLTGFFLSRKINEKFIYSLSVISLCLLGAVNLIGFQLYGGNAYVIGDGDSQPNSLIKAIGITFENPNFEPSETEGLTELLNRIKSETGKRTVAAPYIVSTDGADDYLPITLRAGAPDIVSVSALPRYPASYDPVYSEYTIEEQSIVDQFLSSDNPDLFFEDFSSLLDQFSIDVVVAQNDSRSPYFEALGMNLYDVVADADGNPVYYVYV